MAEVEDSDIEDEIKHDSYERPFAFYACKLNKCKWWFERLELLAERNELRMWFREEHGRYYMVRSKGLQFVGIFTMDMILARLYEHYSPGASGQEERQAESIIIDLFKLTQPENKVVGRELLFRHSTQHAGAVKMLLCASRIRREIKQAVLDPFGMARPPPQSNKSFSINMVSLEYLVEERDSGEEALPNPFTKEQTILVKLKKYYRKHYLIALGLSSARKGMVTLNLAGLVLQLRVYDLRTHYPEHGPTCFDQVELPLPVFIHLSKSKITAPSLVLNQGLSNSQKATILAWCESSILLSDGRITLLENPQVAPPALH